MTTEAEQLANELTEAVECFPEPTRLERAAAALLRSQAAEIDRLRAEANTCGSGAGCCAQAAEIEQLKHLHRIVETEWQDRYDAMCKRKDALLRECLTALEYHTDHTLDTMDKVKTELGEQT